MKRQLPLRPSLSQLRHQSKDLLREIRAGNQDAFARVSEHVPQLPNQHAIALSDAQLVIAREYGFASWPKLKQYIEGLEAVEGRISRLRTEFGSGDAQTRRHLLEPAHAIERFANYDPDAAALSDADARLLIANQEGYAFWSKYESYLHLDPAVQDVIAAVRTGERKKLRDILRTDPGAANPRWVSGFAPPQPVPNDSIPLFCVSEGSFRGTNLRGNEYDLIRDLADAGAQVDFAGGLALASAVSFGVLRAVEALLDCGAAVDGVNGDGAPLAYALNFGFRDVAELLAGRGAKLDLRFASGLGRLDVIKSWFHADGSLKAGAGALVDPYALERRLRGESPWRCERTRGTILSQALYFACVNFATEAVDWLLSQGADMNAIVPGLDVKATVLHRIASTGSGVCSVPGNRETMLRFLLERGADPAVRDEEYHATPIGWARHGGRGEAVDILIAYAGIHEAIASDRVDRVRALLAGDSSLAGARDDLGRLPLHMLHAALKHAEEIVDMLVANSADLNARDADGRTVLARLAQSGAQDLAGYLRLRGALE